jgi:tripartite-type tricarboxylate transporter receptor subunit TctC
VPVLNTLNKAMNDGIRTTQVQEFLARVGSDSLIVTPAEAAQHVQNEVKRWAEIIKKYNIKQV